MSAAPCRDGSGTHLFTIGADRCSICGWSRWPEVVDDAPMTAPEAASGRVPGVTGWTGAPGESTLGVGRYRIVVWRSRTFGDWSWRVSRYESTILSNHEELRAAPGEVRLATAIRVRILAEQALAAHLTEALAALRGTP